MMNNRQGGNQNNSARVHAFYSSAIQGDKIA